MNQVGREENANMRLLRGLRQHREVDILSRLTDSEKASLRSPSGPGAASILSAVRLVTCSATALTCSAFCYYVVSVSPFLQSPAPVRSGECRSEDS